LREKPEDIAKLFAADIRAKKRAARGLYGRARRVRPHEALVMPSERLVGLAKRIMTAPGVCKVMTIGEMKMNELMAKIHNGEIPTRGEIDDLPYAEAQAVVAELRRLYKNPELLKAWHVSLKDFSEFVYGKYKTTRTRSGSVLTGKAAEEYIKHDKRKKAAPEIPTDLAMETKELTVTGLDPMLISINRDFSSEQLSHFLERLGMFLAGVDQRYKLELTIKEAK